MSKTVDYYLSLISPYAYLGSRRLEEIAKRNGAAVQVKPIKLAAIFPSTGGLPLAKRAPARQSYRLVELRRWSSHLNMPLNLHPKHFPADESAAARMVIAAGKSGGDPMVLAHAVLRAVWADEQDVADVATLKEIATRAGHDADALSSLAQDPETETTYERLTREALDCGVFGAPTYVYRNELFWGQDRLDFLDRALAATP